MGTLNTLGGNGNINQARVWFSATLVGKSQLLVGEDSVTVAKTFPVAVANF